MLGVVAVGKIAFDLAFYPACACFAANAKSAVVQNDEMKGQGQVGHIGVIFNRPAKFAGVAIEEDKTLNRRGDLCAFFCT